MDSVEEKIAYYSDEIMRYFEAIPESDRYGFLLSALENAIKKKLTCIKPSFLLSPKVHLISSG